MNSAVHRVAARAPWVYAGGLVAIVAARAASFPRAARTTVVALALGAMVLTFAAERWQTSDDGAARPVTVGVGTVGIAVGGGLAVAGRLAGLAFLAGGLAFLYRGLGGDRV